MASYYERPEERAAVRFLTSGRVEGARALFLEGPPGVGKTYLGEILSQQKGWPLVFYQCHSWTSDQELVQGIDVAAAVAGDAEAVKVDGALLAAAKLSLRGRVVLIIDELDKAPDRIDALLLDYLQSGRTGVDGVRADLNNLLVLITSNGVRETHPALIRRCRRLRMTQLPAEVLDQLVAEKATVGLALARRVRRLCQQAAREDGQESSLQEMVNLAEELKWASSSADVGFAAQGWAARGSEGLRWLATKPAQTLLAEIWRLVNGAGK